MIASCGVIGRMDWPVRNGVPPGTPKIERTTSRMLGDDVEK